MNVGIIGHDRVSVSIVMMFFFHIAIADRAYKAFKSQRMVFINDLAGPKGSEELTSARK